MGDANTGMPAQEGWTYPTRLCRICHEDVPATVTMYPPGLPISLQHPVVEYKNDDEYGRLIRPCLCKGGMRYIHELCLRQSRAAGARPGAKWKCPTCSYQFNFQRLNYQRILESRFSTVAITILVLVILMFILGFFADPIINLYMDPYDTLTTNDYWHAVDVNDIGDDAGWSGHFLKGFFSLGLVGFLKTLLANPFNWWNWRNAGVVGGRTRRGAGAVGTTGRDRAVDISWIAVAVGIASAFYFFYQWVQAVVGRTLHQIGNNIVDTSLPGDDDDIKPPTGWRDPFSTHAAEQEQPEAAAATDTTPQNAGFSTAGRNDAEMDTQKPSLHFDAPTARSSGIDAAQSQGWSFSGL